MNKLSTIRGKDSYQEKLDTIKEEGSLEKQSYPSKQRPSGPPSIRRSSRQSSIPTGGVAVPVQPTSDVDFGSSMFDEDLNLPSSYYSADPQQAQGIFESAVTEERAQNQPGYTKLAAFVPRALAKTGIEFIRGVGYLGAIPLAAIEGDIGAIVENDFTKAMDEFEEAVNEEVPVYWRESVRDGSFLQQISSPEFWGSEFADALGFMASSVLMGGAANVALKPITKGIAGVSKLASQAGKAGKVTAQGLTKGMKAEETMRLLGTTTAQSYVESMAESHGAIQEFNQHWEQRKQPDGTYLKENEDGTTTTLTEDDITRLKEDLVGATFNLNMAVTAVPNWFMSQAFFGSGGAFDNFFNKFGVNPSKAEAGIAKALKTPTFNKVKKTLFEGAKGMVGEAAQEGAQHAIQVYGEKTSRDLEKIDMVGGLIDGAIDAFTSVEGQKAMFLGGLLGLGPGLKKGYAEYKAAVKNAGAITKILEDNWVDMKTQTRGYLKEDENGDLVVDVEKIKSDFKTAEGTIRDIIKLEQAKLEGLPMQAKSILGRMVLKQALPYFDSPEHVEILKSKIPELIENMTEIEKFGFESKEEAQGFVEKLLNNAETSLKQVKKNGPRSFDLDISQLRKVMGEDVLTLEAMNNWYIAQEAQYALQTALLDYNQEEYEKVDQNLKSIESTIDAAYTAQYPQGKMQKTADRMRHMKKPENKIREYNQMLSDKATIEHNMEQLNSNVKLFFDKEEQQKAIDDQVKMIKLQEKMEADIKKGQEEAARFNEAFRSKLEELGWVNSQEELQQKINDGSINNITIRLKDKNGNPWAFKKVSDPKGDTSKWYIFPIDPMTGEAKVDAELGPDATGRVVDMQLMKDLGITEDSIMSFHEYTAWKYEIDARRLNSQYLDAVAETLNLAEETRIKNEADLQDLKDRIFAINETLQSWRGESGTLFSNIQSDELISKIQELEVERDSIEREISLLERSLESTTKEIAYYEELQENLITALDEGVKVDMTFELREILNNLKENGVYVRRRDKLGEAQEAIRNDINDLVDLRDDLNIAIEELYSILENSNILSEMIETGIIKEKDLKRFVRDNINFFRENYPEFLKNPADPNSAVRDFTFIGELFADPEIRTELLQAVKDNIKRNQTFIKDIRKELSNINKALKDAQNTVDMIGRYLEVQQYIENIMTAHDIQQRALKGRGRKKIRNLQTRDGDSRIEQEGGEEIEEEWGPRKEWMYSTIASFYLDGVTRNMRDVTSKEYKQAVDWANAMYNIPLNNLSRYSVRPVNAQGLKDLGQKPPEAEAGSLYAVLMEDSIPYKSEDGSIVFAGIATAEYYFPKGAKPKIDFRNDPELIKIEARVKPITEDNPYVISLRGEDSVWKTDKSESKEEAIEGLIQRRKAEYNKWRDKIVEDTKTNKPLNFNIRHISRGWPVEAGNQAEIKRHNPKKALGAQAVTIPKRNTMELDNNETIFVQSGMPYVKLKNGHYQRVKNYTIGELPETIKENPNGLSQERVLNTMLELMALAKDAGGDVKRIFPFAATEKKENRSTFDQMPLAGSKSRPGFLDLFINWNSKRDAFNIHFTKMRNGKVGIVWKDGTEKETWMTIDELFDGNRIRKYNDSSAKVQQLVDFLKSKYLNVVSTQTANPKTGKSKAFRFPKGVRAGSLPGEKVITYDFYENYDDFVMDNYLYTHIPPQTESDATPPYVNQYIIFDNIDTPVTEQKDVVPDTDDTGESDTTSPFGTGWNTTFYGVFGSDPSSTENASEADKITETVKLTEDENAEEEDKEDCGPKGKDNYQSPF